MLVTAVMVAFPSVVTLRLYDSSNCPAKGLRTFPGSILVCHTSTWLMYVLGSLAGGAKFELRGKNFQGTIVLSLIHPTVRSMAFSTISWLREPFVLWFVY